MDGILALKAGTVALSTLEVLTNDLSAFEAALARKQSEAPSLMRNFPCAVDVAGHTPEGLDLCAALVLCKRYGLLPVAVRNADASWLPLLDKLQIANLGSSRVRTTTGSVQKKRPLRIYKGHVRSGQQVFHDGDLAIFGTVSAGAEVLACGDLHIYGVLRGRALAGIKGDENATIICAQGFDAELVAIAGQYKVFEESPKSTAPTCVRLQDGSLNITAIS